VKALLALIDKHHVRVAIAVGIACLEVLGFHNLNGEIVLVRLPSGGLGAFLLAYDLGAGLDFCFRLQLVELLLCELDVVQDNEGLHLVS
jgi:hypothetical protein